MTSRSASVVRRPGRVRTARALLGILALAGTMVGGWAEAAPAAFYRTFPGFGRHWLPPLGPFNEHLVRDFGALNLGLAAAAVVAAITLTRSATATAAAAWLVYSLPHLAFHAAHLDAFVVGDDVGVLATLAASAVTAALALWLVLTGTATTQRAQGEQDRTTPLTESTSAA